MLWIIVIFLGISIYYFIQNQRIPLPTASGAFIMASDILVNVFLKQKSISHVTVEVTISILSAILIGFALSFIQEAKNGRIYSRHLSDPIASFAAGTWVAAISVTIITISRWLPELHRIAILFYGMNVFLWLGFMILASRNFFLLWSNEEKRNHVNGVIFLSCVATQSMALATTTLFGNHLTLPVLGFLVTIGGVFYLLSFSLIILRLIKLNWGNLAEEWTNTNCIIHGALSITGLAGILTGTLSVKETGFLWLFTAFLFVLVEGIELARVCQRIKRLGWKKGLLVYHCSQWARNFTCGMFMAFTLNLPWNECQFCNNTLSIIWKDLWIYIGVPFLLLLFMVEFGLFAYEFSRSQIKHQTALHRK